MRKRSLWVDTALLLTFLAVAAVGGLIGWSLHSNREAKATPTPTVVTQPSLPQTCTTKLSECLASVAGPDYIIQVNGVMGYRVVPKTYSPPTTTAAQGKEYSEEERARNDPNVPRCC